MQSTVTGSDVKVVYTEPTTNADGSPLTDLDHTSIFYQLSGGSASKVMDVPASTPQGGGTITQIVTIPVTGNAQSDVTLWATASDGSGNESTPSTTTVVRIDRLAPAPPQ